jgi:hypothetical protein
MSSTRRRFDPLVPVAFLTAMLACGTVTIGVLAQSSLASVPLPTTPAAPAAPRPVPDPTAASAPAAAPVPEPAAVPDAPEVAEAPTPLPKPRPAPAASRSACSKAPVTDGHVGWAYATTTKPTLTDGAWAVPLSVNVRAEYPSRANGYNAKTQVVCVLFGGTTVKVAGEAVQAPGGSWWVPIAP